MIPVFVLAIPLHRSGAMMSLRPLLMITRLRQIVSRMSVKEGRNNNRIMRFVNSLVSERSSWDGGLEVDLVAFRQAIFYQ